MTVKQRSGLGSSMMKFYHVRFRLEFFLSGIYLQVCTFSLLKWLLSPFHSKLLWDAYTYVTLCMNWFGDEELKPRNTFFMGV